MAPDSEKNLVRVWETRNGTWVDFGAYRAAARRLSVIDAAWSRTATSCRPPSPCYSCCVRALRALEAAAEHQAEAG